jgi:signal transduction histidine kinase
LEINMATIATGQSSDVIGPSDVTDRRRLERDLHDGVQNELVALMVKLTLAQEDQQIPPGIADMLADLELRAQAALDSVRNIARGVCPPRLAEFGLREALRAQAMHLAIGVSVVGTVPRSHAPGEEAVYFSCSEAIQNAAKHAGRGAHVTLRLAHRRETLRVLIADDGRGFNPARTLNGAGLRNIRDRIEGLGGSFKVASRFGLGTALTISLPWPTPSEDVP